MGKEREDETELEEDSFLGEVGDPQATDEADEGQEGEDGEKKSDVTSNEDPKQNRVVPQNRFDRVVKERNEAQERLAYMENRIREIEAVKRDNGAPEEGTDSSRKEARELRRQYREALLDGDEAKLEVIDNKLEALMAAQLEQRLLKRTEGNFEMRQARTRRAEMEQNLYIEHPIFDKDSAEFNPDAFGELSSEYQDNLRHGMPEDKALSKAMRAVVPSYVSRSTPAEAVRKERVNASRAKLDALRRQPGRPEGGSNVRAASGVTMDGMTEEKWRKLPQEEKNKMLYSRG